MRRCRSEVARQRDTVFGERRYLPLVGALGLSAVLVGLSGCSGQTALDSLLAEYNAEPGACVGPTFDAAIEDAEFECWRVVGVDDVEAFTEELVVAVNGGTTPDPDRSFCFFGLPVAPEAVVSCTVEFGSDDQWFAVEVERDLYSTEWESLEATGDFPADTVSTVVIARSTSTLSPEGVE